MGLDILLFRAEVGGNPDLVRESQRRRHKDPAAVDAVIEWDEKWRKLVRVSERVKKATNAAQAAITAKFKAKEAEGSDGSIDNVMALAEAGEDVPESLLKPMSIFQLKKFKDQLKILDTRCVKEAEEAAILRDKELAEIGNIVHESVPVHIDEDFNRVERTYGTQGTKEKHPLNHVDLMERLGCMDTSERVTKMSGSRAYVLKGGLVNLQLALTNFAMQFLGQRGYTPFYPPFFMNRDVMGEVAQLAQFDDELYKVTGEGDDKYLIATSEQPIAAYHRGRWYTDIPEPIKYAGMSSCFRKEVGSHGRDTLGIFRVHQFDKIEQFVVCTPRDGESWKQLDQMIGTSEAFMQALGLPYRVVNICSGALNNAAAMKYDLEAWFPASQTYRELVSCSNCTDYQARALGTRFGSNTRGTTNVNVKEYVHMLNGTLCALTRTMCCIVENYQTEDGIVIPEVLRPFMLGTEKLAFDPEVIKAIQEAEKKAAEAAEKKGQQAEKKKGK